LKNKEEGKMKVVQVHRIRDDGHISAYWTNVYTDVDDIDRIMRLFGLEYGFAMEKVSENVYSTQYGDKYTIVRE
jgi:hypothetical protein